MYCSLTLGVPVQRLWWWVLTCGPHFPAGSVSLVEVLVQVAEPSLFRAAGDSASLSSQQDCPQVFWPEGMVCAKSTGSEREPLEESQCGSAVSCWREWTFLCRYAFIYCCYPPNTLYSIHAWLPIKTISQSWNCLREDTGHLQPVDSSGLTLAGDTRKD